VSGFRKSTTGSGTISTITSTDSTVTVTDPTGPSTNLKVAGVDGVIITGTPTVGQVPTATSGTAADWATPSGGSGITTLTSTDFTVTNATGPTANLDGPLLANLAAGGFKLTGLANGSGAADSAAFGQIAAAVASYLPLAGGTMSGAIAMGTHKVTGLGNGTAAQDAAAFGQIPAVGPLAVVEYGTSGFGTSYTISSATLAAVDSTNLTIAFTTKASGPGSTVVLVDIEAGYSGVAASIAYVALLNHVGGAQQGFTKVVDVSLSATVIIIATRFRVSGLSASTSYQFDLAASKGATNNFTMYANSDTGLNSGRAPIEMTVWPGL